MKEENEKVIQEIIDSIRQLYRTIQLDSSKMSRKYGLTAPQSSVLRMLSKYGPLASTELSRMLYMTPSNITGIIDRMEKKGLVTRIRQPGDRRVVLLQLTEKGAGLSKTLPDPIEEKLSIHLSSLESGQVQQLKNGIYQILQLIDAHNIEDIWVEFEDENNHQ
jgi:DNA-binding MarR family transcriptional regulator